MNAAVCISGSTKERELNALNTLAAKREGNEEKGGKEKGGIEEKCTVT